MILAYSLFDLGLGWSEVTGVDEESIDPMTVAELQSAIDFLRKSEQE